MNLDSQTGAQPKPPKDLNELVVAMPRLLSGTIDGGDDDDAESTVAPPIADPEVAKILRRRGKIADARERIILPGPGRLLSDCAAELGAKLAQGGKIFRRHGRAVVVDDEKREISEITEVQFISWLESSDGGRVVCQQFAGRGEKSRLIETTMSKTCAEAILACRAFIQSLPEIRRINRVRLPVWNFYDPQLKTWPRKGGIVSLLAPGYDEETATYTFDEAPFGEINIFEALKILDRWFCDVAIDPADSLRSAAVIHAMLLTPFCDLMIGDKAHRPAFMVVGNCEGCGKTLLVKLALVPVFGPVAVTAFPLRDKMSEIINAVARDGRPYLFLDNIKGECGDTSLEAFLSAGRISGRTLGQKDTFDVEKRCLVYLTGNKVTVSPDMRRRLLFVNLFLSDARPELRSVKRRIEENDILNARSEILAALWSIVRFWAYDMQFKIGHDNASFWQWGQIIGGMVESVLHEKQSPLATPKMERDQRLLLWEKFMPLLADDVDNERQFAPGELREAARSSGLFSFLAETEEGLSDKDKREERSIFGKRFCDHFLGRCFDVSGGRLWFLDNGELGRGRRYIVTRNRNHDRP